MAVMQCKLAAPNDLPLLTTLIPMDSRGVTLGYMFRGQSARFPALVPKADRLFTGDLSHSLFGKRSDLQAVQLQYQRIIHNVQPGTPSDTTWLEWQAMIQHYGGPTRLLDVTVSPMVAAYFACQDADAELGACIWCIRMDEADITSVVEDMLHLDDPHDAPKPETPEEKRVQGEQRYHEAMAFLSGLWEGKEAALDVARQFHEAEVLEKLINRLSDEERKALHLNRAKALNPFSEVVFVRPFRMNARLLAQQGAFAMTLNHRKDFMNCLVKDKDELNTLLQPDWSNLPSMAEIWPAVRETSPSVLRVWLPADIAKRTAHSLSSYNVTGFSLFPDFSGFTQALNEVQRLFGGYNPFKSL